MYSMSNNSDFEFHIIRHFQIVASILFIVQPIGNLLSGFIVESMGKKRTIVIINIIPSIAWIMLPNVQSQHATYIAFVFLGVGIGLTSSINYISEIR